MQSILVSTTFLTLALALTPATAQQKSDAAGKVAPKAPAAKAPTQPPDQAAPKVGANGQTNAAFLISHGRFVKSAKEGKAQLLFLGDSITAGWGRQTNIWNQAFGKYQPLNFGIGGDRTQHVLWRVENGELDGLTPKVAVLMIGTNNARGDSAGGIASGIRAIIDAIRRRSPRTKILLLAVFPRGDRPDGNFGKAYENIKQVNALIAKYADGKTVHYLNIGEKFLVAGKVTKEIMPDFLHLSAAGYQIWADAITPKLTELMK